jgi:biopolymer transport protein ExbD
MRRISRLRIAQWLLLLMALVAGAFFVTRPGEPIATGSQAGPVNLRVGADGDLMLDGVSVKREAWIRRLHLAVIQVPQPPIRISGSPRASAGEVHKALREAWLMHQLKMGYVVRSQPELVVPITEPTEKQFRDAGVGVTLDFNADGEMYWDSMPLDNETLQTQVVILNARGNRVRITVRAEAGAKWRSVADALSVIGKCAVCDVGSAEETFEVIRQWLPPPPPHTWPSQY